ncbi:MAG: hypothetical protein OXT09_13030 [Myxococcales bacterium]|nr:hypothetical protein [Myxococcales bacterium]
MGGRGTTWAPRWLALLGCALVACNALDDQPSGAEGVRIPGSAPPVLPPTATGFESNGVPTQMVPGVAPPPPLGPGDARETPQDAGVMQPVFDPATFEPLQLESLELGGKLVTAWDADGIGELVEIDGLEHSLRVHPIGGTCFTPQLALGPGEVALLCTLGDTHFALVRVPVTPVGEASDAHTEVVEIGLGDSPRGGALARIIHNGSGYLLAFDAGAGLHVAPILEGGELGSPQQIGEASFAVELAREDGGGLVALWHDVSAMVFLQRLTRDGEPIGRTFELGESVNAPALALAAGSAFVARTVRSAGGAAEAHLTRVELDTGKVTTGPSFAACAGRCDDQLATLKLASAGDELGLLFEDLLARPRRVFLQRISAPHMIELGEPVEVYMREGGPFQLSIRDPSVAFDPRIERYVVTFRDFVPFGTVVAGVNRDAVATASDTGVLFSRRAAGTIVVPAE